MFKFIVLTSIVSPLSCLMLVRDADDGEDALADEVADVVKDHCNNIFKSTVATSIRDRNILLLKAPSLLSPLSDDLQIHIFSLWLDVRSLATLDVAVSSRRLRHSWLTVLRCLRSYDLGRWHLHSLSSLTWLSKRGIFLSPVFMKINCHPEHPDGHVLMVDTGDIVRIGPLRNNDFTDQSMVDIMYCRGASDMSFAIDLARCDQMTDAGVIALAAVCGNLRSIDLAGCDKVTDAGVVALGAGCGELQHINLAGCGQVTDAGVIALGAGCGELLSINLAGCIRVTDAGVTALGAGCRELQSIDLTCCSKVTDAGVIALSERGQLQSINLRYCCRVTLEGVIALGAGCRQL